MSLNNVPHLVAPHAMGTESICPRQRDRRAFLRDMAVAAVAALFVNGVTPQDALADGARMIVPEELRAGAGGMERVYSIPAADGVYIDEPQRLVLARWEGRLFGFSVECPHRGEILEWRADEGRIFCPKHKVRWSASGTRVSGRNTRDLDRYSLRRDGSRVVIATDHVLTSDRHADEWRAAYLDL